ncbi:MAG: BREX-1 system adenine-specific DNA-methyltransferase PglX [Blastocatellia bacterium]|nr:BREX-1 system adenine-specific DNA-methyltransferase PglX [Blastocatellia bacterium]
MAFDQQTRSRLQRFVSDARDVLTKEFTRQLQNEYGLDPVSGAVTPIENLGHLDDARRETARILRDTLTHYLATSPSGSTQEALERIAREQAFTVLNRFAALRMAEAREILIESLAEGYNSKGFQLYARLAGTGLGERGDAYRCYLFSIFDEFALDLKVLFDRFSPYGRLFPRENALLELLGLMNDPEIAPLWTEDETIGWIYQYFNSKDERKKMREASSAPRNSRELAVRNQFFTPRYVVEFLTDNTLGRIWYEMIRGETRLKDQCRYLVRRPNEIFLAPGESPPDQVEDSDQNLSQEELLKQPVSIPHRPMKDPREIRVLDPACGSMHFGLYAFDLLETIYEEAWDLECGDLSPLSVRGRDDEVATSRSTSNMLEGEEIKLRQVAALQMLREEYPDKDAFLRDVPRLIVEHNLHGIDIDPRAVQIAGLSLWLRAQRAWKEQDVKSADRPQIRRSNIVCAEPMPGEEALLQEFIDRHFSATPELRLIGQLVRRVFEEMKLAGEAGSLLKIEEEIADAVAEAKEKWLETPKFEQSRLFAEMAKPEQQRLGFDVSEITDERFWEKAEEQIYAALRAYAEHAENGGGYQRRLFADDAARGFAFIDICRKRYDVVLMNPPFGDATPASAPVIKKEYPDYAENLYVAFHQRASHSLTKGGLVGTISSRTFVFYRDFEAFRTHLLDVSRIKVFADLGWEVLDSAQVETAAFVTGMNVSQDIPIGPFFRLLTTPIDEKDCILLSAVRFEMEKQTFFTTAKLVKRLPGAPLCYWSSRQFIDVVSKSPQLQPSCAYVGQGASPHAFFFRTWWEVPSNGIGGRWKRICRGGDYSPFYRSNALVIDWFRNGSCVKEYINKKYPYLNGNYSWKIQDEDKYGLPGLTWGKRNERFNVQAMAAEHIFTDEGQGIVPLTVLDADFLLGYLNSSLVAYFLSLTSGLQKHWVYIRPIPIINIALESRDIVAKAARDILQIKQHWDTTSEISAIYLRTLPAPISKDKPLRDLTQEYEQFRFADSATILNLRQQINDTVFSHTILNRDDVAEIRTLLDTFPKDVPNIDGLFASKEESSNDVASSILSYGLGASFGRWDIRFATGEKPEPELPDPFAPLPVCPPGMLQNEQGLPAEPNDVPDTYALRISWGGILVDDPGHAEDIEGRMREVLHVIWRNRAEAIEQEACEILGVRSLRDYLSKPAAFFADHLKRYSKSRRQAPIYWPLSTASGSYTLWLYYHRLTDQTLYTCVNNFIEPKLSAVRDTLSQLRAKAGRSRDEEKEFERLQDFELELQQFRDELLRLARLPWHPNLNDGVQITAAPLWNLFRLSKWQKTLKDTWQKLEKGEYDWAHLAYTLWPERVREKCKKDKSLAIAHGLEELYEEPPAPAKKKRARKGSRKS